MEKTATQQPAKKKTVAEQMSIAKNVTAYLNKVKSKQPKTAITNSRTKQADGIDIGISELKLAGIYERFWQCSFSKLKRVPADIRENAKMIYTYSKNISEHIDNGTGLILAGNYGTMKTTLAVCVLRAYLEQGGRGLFIPMCSLMDNLYTMKARNIEEWANFEKRLRETALLVIDDLGGEDVGAPWVLAKINSIITERYNRKKPVIITTNMSKDELVGTYSGRLIDRLKSTNYYLSFNATSKRKALSIKDLQEKEGN